jgi:flavin-dependent dehydrogenase
VCIVGGGPAGSFAALHLSHLAAERSLDLEILLFEARPDDAVPGPASCKGCAGVLSTHLVRSMERMGLTLPQSVIQAEIDRYIVHLQDEVVSVEQPEAGRRIVSVYRGRGPRMLEARPLTSFDQYLRRQAAESRARVIHERVRSVAYLDRPQVQTSSGEWSADLLVLATGCNTAPPLAPRFAYRGPKTDMMVQDEIHRPADWDDRVVSAFLGLSSDLTFGAFVPKGPYLNISLLGHGMNREAVDVFYDSHKEALREYFRVAPSKLCGCTPRIPIGMAKRYFGDRWVAVGDAAVSRLYKDGIGSSFITARAAVRSAVEIGLRRADFQRGYQPTCRAMARENAYGRMLFRVCSWILSKPRWARAWSRRVQAERQGQAQEKVYSRLLWGMLTGDDSYRELFWLMFSRESMAGFWDAYRDLAREE